MQDEHENQNVGSTIERATIADLHKEKLSRLSAQANNALLGVASITKSDIVNLLLEDHPNDLSETQIEKLRSRHVDEVKYAFWIAKRLKQARADGEALSLQDILAQNSMPLSGRAPTQKRTRRKRKKEIGDSPDAVTPEQPES